MQMTMQTEKRFQSATNYRIWKGELRNDKVRDHSHILGHKCSWSSSQKMQLNNGNLTLNNSSSIRDAQS